MHPNSEVRGLRRAELITAELAASAGFYEELLSWRALRSVTGCECWVGERQCASMRPPRVGEVRGWSLVLAGAAHNGALTGPEDTSAEMTTGRAQHGPWAPEPRTGEPCWIELSTASGDRADTFWTETLRWTVAPDLPETTYATGGRPVASRTTVSRPDGRWGWLCYYAVDDVDAAGDRVASLGGKVIGSTRHWLLNEVLVVEDPQGGVVGLARGNERWGA